MRQKSETEKRPAEAVIKTMSIRSAAEAGEVLVLILRCLASPLSSPANIAR